jgi:membrane protease subunit HflC
MKTNRLGMIIGFLLLLIFGMMLFMYQVRVTEVAVKTRFGKVVDTIDKPGVGFKMPWPIERIQRFDRRVQSFQDKFDETLTQDGRNLMIMLYLGWSIESPAIFRDRIQDGSIDEAERNLMSIVRSAKLEVVGQYPFSAFINTDEAKLKFTEIEGEILALIQPQATSTYGIRIHFLGIKRLQLPPAITDKVFERMKAERMKLVQTYTSEGQAAATRIGTEADRDRAEKLAAAETEAKRIMGEADAAASASYEVFQQEPELAIFLLKLQALEASLQDRATLFLDTTTSPFDILAKPEAKPTK